MMTRRNPSKTSRSLRLSRSFLTEALSRGFVALREFRAAEAASSVSSRAGRAMVSLGGTDGENKTYRSQGGSKSSLSTPWLRRSRPRQRELDALSGCSSPETVFAWPQLIE